MREFFIMSPLTFSEYMYAVMKEVKGRMGNIEMRFLKEEREWRIPSLFYVDDLALWGESEEMVGCFVEVCRRRCLRFNADKSKVMVICREERMACDVLVNRVQMEHVLECKYFGVF